MRTAGSEEAWQAWDITTRTTQELCAHRFSQPRAWLVNSIYCRAEEEAGNSSEW